MSLAPQDIRTFFVTTITADRRRLFQVESNAELLMKVVEENRTMGRFKLHAFVLMPDHVHLVLTPAPDISLEKAMQFIKGGFSFRLKSKLDVWQRSFEQHRLKDKVDYMHHVRYVEANPIRKRLAESASEFPYSSASRGDLVDVAPSHLG